MEDRKNFSISISFFNLPNLLLYPNLTSIYNIFYQMPTKLLIIAGPQSSGKTTAFNYLKSKYPDYHYQEEINPYYLAGKNHGGAAFTTNELELKLVEADLQMLCSLKNKKLNGYKGIICETSIFHLVYTENFCGLKTADEYLKKYLLLHDNFDSYLLFIDTKPEVSWRRRYPNYLTRTKSNGGIEALEKYQNTIYKLYPIWLKWYDRIPFKKQTIRNSFITKETFIEKIDAQLLQF